MTILLTASSFSDLRFYRIPNYLIVSGWLMGLAFRLSAGGVSGLWDGLFCIAAGIVLLFPVYLLNGMGAGDVKLLSVICGIYGLAFWARTTVVFAVLSAAGSLVHMIRKKCFVHRFRYFFRYVFGGGEGAYYDSERDGREMVIPLAPILAAAYFIVYLCRQGGWH
jgi:prepilin peptidase CpaA